MGIYDRGKLNKPIVGRKLLEEVLSSRVVRTEKGRERKNSNSNVFQGGKCCHFLKPDFWWRYHIKLLSGDNYLRLYWSGVISFTGKEMIRFL